MSELKSRRFADQEPDFGDPDFEGVDTYKELSSSTKGVNITDEFFDEDNPSETKRMQEELEKDGEDPTDKNMPAWRIKG
jgi:hypothetical protein